MSNSEPNTEWSQVSQFYDGKSIFVTGATGFMGKVFARLSRETLKKVVAIDGDISLPDLGLSEKERAILQEEVSVVFHSAATVRFQEPLRKSLTINLLGTKRVVELSRGMRNLKSFVHVSTCYAHCDRSDTIEEKIYGNPRNVSASHLLTALEWMDQEMLERVCSKLIVGRPNTYTLTKAITESYLQEEARLILPAVAIVRPSIVTASWKEPLPGWVDSFNGVTGAYMTAYLGLMKAVKIDRSVIGDFMPVDLVINLVIVVGWKNATNEQSRPANKDKCLLIYNCSSNGTNPVRWSTIEDVSRVAGMEWPSINTFRYPKFTTYSANEGTLSPSNFLYWLDICFRHYAPAVIGDAVLKILGKEPRFCDYLNKSLKGYDAVAYFSTRSWKFDTRNVIELWETLPDTDRVLFNFDIDSIEWPIAIQNHIRGMRRYILDEADNNVIEARVNLRRLRYLNMAMNFVFWGTVSIGAYYVIKIKWPSIL